MTTSALPPAPDPEPVRLRARRPADLLAVVPYLLGFHPVESLVAILLSHGQVLLTARRDLILPGQDAADLVDPMVQEIVDRHAPSGVVLVAYCSDVERGRRLLRAQAADLDGAELLDALLVDGDRWWSLVCEDGCCPAEGLPYAPAEHPLSAEAVWAGLMAAPDRSDVVARVAGPPDDDLADLRRRARSGAGELRLVPVARQRTSLTAAVVEALPRVDPGADGDGAGGRRLDDDACAALALLVRAPVARDLACALITREDARRHVALWQEVVSRTPPELASAPLCLLGIAAWAEGNGTLLNACADRLAGLDPRYPMGRLLRDVSVRGLPPSWWDAMADGLRADLGLAG